MATWTWRTVRLPLVKPLRVGGQDLAERVVLILRRDPKDGGNPSFGEVSPLPGLHDESLDEVIAALPGAIAMLDPVLAGRMRPSSLITDVGRDPRWGDLPPSLRSGMEQVAVWALADRLRQTDPAAVLAEAMGVSPGDAPPTAILIDDDGDLTEARGAACVKVKVGRRDRDDDISLLRTLRSRLGESGDQVEIRLDANRAFTLGEAVALAEALPDLRPAFIEEPVFDPTDLPGFMMLTGWPVALDETLFDPAHTLLVRTLPATAWVIKPARCGIRGTLEMFAAARSHPDRPSCIVSSSFEGSQGMGMLDSLAACAPGLPAPGLGTAHWFGMPRPGEWKTIHGAG